MLNRTALIVLFLAGHSAASAATVTYDALGRVASVTYDDAKSVTYTYDAAGNRTQHVVSASANLPPDAVDDAASMDVQSSLSLIIDAKSNDTDPNNDPLTITAATNGAKGTVAIQGGGASLLYTFTGNQPGPGLTTSDTFSYTISDGKGGTDTAQVTISIENSACPGICN